MKIATKCIANRLKVFLDDIVSENRSAFVPGRLITDNVMVGYEIFHYIKKKRTRKNGVMASRLDMSKAYDRVEWVFLKKVLHTMAFPE